MRRLKTDLNVEIREIVPLNIYHLGLVEIYLALITPQLPDLFSRNLPTLRDTIQVRAHLKLHIPKTHSEM